MIGTIYLTINYKTIELLKFLNQLESALVTSDRRSSSI